MTLNTLANTNVTVKVYYIVGGVLRNSVIAKLSAIITSLLFGGDVDEGQHKEAAGEVAFTTNRYVCRSENNKKCIWPDRSSSWGRFICISKCANWIYDIKPYICMEYRRCRGGLLAGLFILGSESCKYIPKQYNEQYIKQRKCQCAHSVRKKSVTIYDDCIAISERRWAA